MRYRVVLTENAKLNLRGYYLRAAESAPKTAADWLDRFEKALQMLGQHPKRCQLAMENSAVPEEIRQFQFGKRRGCYRVLFTIAGEASGTRPLILPGLNVRGVGEVAFPVSKSDARRLILKAKQAP